MSNPTISIIIPTYKRPDKLYRALDSIASSTSSSKDIIVIDDCIDGTAFHVAQKFSVRYLNKGGINRGHSESRNLGLSLARGDFIAFLDDDDCFCNGGLDRLLEAAYESRADCIVHGNYQTFDGVSESKVSTAGADLRQLLVCNRIPVGSYIMRKGSIRSRFDVTLRSHEDWDFLLRNLRDCQLLHADFDIVKVDKTAEADLSTSMRRRRFFWIDFISIYARFPNSELCAERSEMLKRLGIGLDPELLRFDDLI